MKKIFFVLILFTNVHVYAQGLSNFFSQKEADIKYMLAQIAELQIYISDVEKGYSIAQKGLTFIGDLKKGELDLHSAFFSLLSTVSPAVKNYQRVADILAMELTVMNILKSLPSLKNMNSSEIAYLQQVYSHMAVDCGQSLDALISILTDDDFQMKDNERIAQIDHIYSDLLERQSFAQSFAAGAVGLSQSRSSEAADAGTVGNYYLK